MEILKESTSTPNEEEETVQTFSYFPLFENKKLIPDLCCLSTDKLDFYFDQMLNFAVIKMTSDPECIFQPLHEHYNGNGPQ